MAKAMNFGVSIYMEKRMKIKVLLFLIFSMILLSSCSAETEEKLNGIKDSEITEIEKINNNNENPEEEILNNKEHDEIIEQIVNDIRMESGVTEDIELSDIKRIHDTYYVVVKVNKPDLTDQYYMLWKYNNTAKEMLLKGNIIEIAAKDNYYYVNYLEDSGDKYRIIKYNHNDESYEKIIYEGSSLKFSFSPNNEYMFIEAHNQVDNTEIIVLDEDYGILFKSSIYNNGENVYDHHPVEIKFIKWSKDNTKLWVATGWNAYVMTFHLIDIENSTLKTYYTGENYGITEIDLNPNNGSIAYSTKPEFYESGSYDEFMQNQTPIYLYFLNLYTGEKVEIAKSITMGFRPKWINNKEIEYNNPDSFMRLTFNIDDYYLNNEDNPEKEEIWQDVEGTTPYVNDNEGNWYYNETTYKIKLKIPSIYYQDSPGVYFYQREDNKGCYISLLNFIYESDKNISFIKNVEKIYPLNNYYVNEDIFVNGKIEEGVSDNGYKYAYFTVDEVSEGSLIRIISYIFVQLDDDVICKLEYRLFYDDFDKFDAKVIINSITHTLTTGPWKDEFLDVHDLSSDTAKQVNFKVPYFYVKNYRGVKYYESKEKEGFFCYIHYWIDDKEELLVHINDGKTAIEYMGNITEGYTKNGYKYSYYVEEKEKYYHNPETNMSEDILVLITNISVRLDENSVLKMDYELTEKDYSLFDINEVLDSINIAPETFMVTLDHYSLFISNTTDFYSTKPAKIDEVTFKIEYYDNSKGENFEDVFKWDGKEFFKKDGFE
ncbi:MAG: hypothetical protein PHE34_02960 [Tissierellia bacterium]|nr:hypothetical protein [Tissierellia bacterium]